MTDNDGLLSEAEMHRTYDVAREWGLGVRTVDRWAREGR